MAGSSTPFCGSTASRVLMAGGLYSASGVAITAYNKWLLHYHQFTFPITMVMFTSVLSMVLCYLAIVTFLQDSVVQSPLWITRIDRRTFLREFVWMGVFSSVDIALTNASFLSLSVTIVEVVKSCTPILVWLSNLVRGKEEFTFSMLLVVVLLCAGSALASLGGHVTLHVIGFLCAITAACAGALKLVLMETALSRHRQELHTHPLLLWMYIAPVMVACLFFPWLLLEARSLFASPLIQPVALPFTIGYLLIAGVLAFSLVSSELWTIQVTSALSLCVIGILRVVIIIAVTMTLFNDYHASRTNVIGLLLCFIGAAGYNWLRLQKLHSTDAVDGEVEGDESNTASAEEVQALQSTVIDTDGSGSSMVAAGGSAAAGRNAEGDSLLRDTGSVSQTGGGRYSSSAASSGATGAGLKPASRDATSARTWPSEPDSGDSADSTQRRLEEQTAKIDRALQEG